MSLVLATQFRLVWLTPQGAIRLPRAHWLVIINGMGYAGGVN